MFGRQSRRLLLVIRSRRRGGSVRERARKYEQDEQASEAAEEDDPPVLRPISRVSRPSRYSWLPSWFSWLSLREQLLDDEFLLLDEASRLRDRGLVRDPQRILVTVALGRTHRLGSLVRLCCSRILHSGMCTTGYWIGAGSISTCRTFARRTTAGYSLRRSADRWRPLSVGNALQHPSPRRSQQSRTAVNAIPCDDP